MTAISEGSDVGDYSFGDVRKAVRLGGGGLMPPYRASVFEVLDGYSGTYEV